MSDKETFMKLLTEAGKFHGEICGGVVMGTKMAIYGMELLGMEPGVKNKKLIVFTEINRCPHDGIQSVTKTSVGKRSIKPMNIGKTAATFINQETGIGYRLADSEKNKQLKEKGTYKEETIEERIERIANTPAEELYTAQKVRVDIDPLELPGKPLDTAVCASCGEGVTDGKHIQLGGKTYCKSCAKGSYYRFIE